MTFEEILAQVLELLQREKRVSYRALKLRFAINDDYIEGLKDELIYAKKLAVDEENRVLVWIGDTASGQAVAPQPAQPTPQPAIQAPSPPDARPSAAPRTLEAERRQLTVMFCDLVDSTKLSSQLDPEEYREVVRAYQAICAEVIQRFDGHVAQLLGDGLLVYFGYPQAHEDDAQRAVRTGLGILAAMGELHQGLQHAQGIQLALRLGVHTGLVVVGEMGGAGRQEQLALGEVPNIASRIEGLAMPNTVAVSEATYRLIQGYFECQDLGAHALRGVPESMCIYRVLGESGVHSRLDVAQPRGLTPLVGRESEVRLLLERWEHVKAGQGHVVLLTGDAGIGKSRLVQMLKDHVTHEPHMRWECRSVEYSQNSVLYPIIDLFQRLMRFEAHETSDEKVGKLEHALSQYRPPLEESVPLFAPLLALPVPAHAYPPLNLSPQRQRQKTLETIGAILLELAEQQPVLFIVEDLHWTDPTTLELLNLIIEQTPTASLLVLLTCRPHFQPAWHHRSYITEMTLNHLSHAQVAQIVTGMTNGKTFPAEVLQQIIAKTDGVPLFVEEITKAILESGQLKVVDEHYELTGSLSTLTIPATLQDSLMARLDRLVTAKAVAQYAAVIGRQFPYDLLQAVSQVDEAMLQHELGRLVEAEIVFQRGVPPQATYSFKHALIQDTAYQSLLRSTRQQYHQQVAQMLEARFPDTVETEPELVAHHYTEAGCYAQAVGYWQQAGQRAMQRSANVEAIAHLRQGIELLTALPDTPARVQAELTLQTTLGPALIATRGFAAPEVAATYTRARELCQQAGDTAELFPVLFGLWLLYLGRAEHETARELGEQCLSLARRLNDPALLLMAHLALGMSGFSLGQLSQAHAHVEQGMRLYDPHQHHALAFRYGTFDPGVACLTFAGLTLWLLGYPDQALKRANEALTLAQHLGHPYTLARGLHYTTFLHELRREWQVVSERADTVITVATAQQIALMLAVGPIMRGWALAMQGQGAEGLTQLRQGLDAYRATGAAFQRPHFLGMLAEVHSIMGQTEAGLTALSEALTLVEKTGERYYEAELHRLKGELLLQQTPPDAQQAATCFCQALDVARCQQAKSLELRAAMSLAHLWQQQGKRSEAYELLVPIYGWFTEGFDTADLQEAKALLEALA
jgi:class 3 adenylate cyclase/predicted ATPase/energy-coupling factor transporter ATP-binding protein EcfA2